MNEEYDKILTKAMDDYIAAWKEKGFNEYTRNVLFILAGSEEGRKTFPNTAAALSKLTEITKKYDVEQTVLDEFFNLILKDNPELQNLLK